MLSLDSGALFLFVVGMAIITSRALCRWIHQMLLTIEETARVVVEAPDGFQNNHQGEAGEPDHDIIEGKIYGAVCT